MSTPNKYNRDNINQTQERERRIRQGLAGTGGKSKAELKRGVEEAMAEAKRIQEDSE